MRSASTRTRASPDLRSAISLPRGGHGDAARDRRPSCVSAGRAGLAEREKRRRLAALLERDVELRQPAAGRADGDLDGRALAHERLAASRLRSPARRRGRDHQQAPPAPARASRTRMSEEFAHVGHRF